MPASPPSNRPPAAPPAFDGPLGSTGTRDRLLRAGLARAKQHGLRALTVRAVAADAGVNLGSFVYHFGSREAFVAELIEHWYAPLMQRTQAMLARAQHVSGDAPVGLRELLLGIADWMLAERVFVGHLVMDAAAGESAARRFLLSSADRHPAIVLRAIVEAQMRGELRQEDPLHLMLALVALIGLPLVLFETLNGRAFLPAPFADAFERYATDREHLAQRLDWLLRGLEP